MKALSIFVAYVAGLIGLLPTLAGLFLAAAVAWFGISFLIRLVEILIT